MSRKQPKRRAGNMVFNTIAGIFILAIVCGVGFGVASADSSHDSARSGAFGLTAATLQAETESSSSSSKAAQQEALCEQSVLATTSARTIDSGLKMIDDREEAARAQMRIENKAALERVKARKAMQGIVQSVQETAIKRVDEELYEYDLPAVDWTVGKDAFVSEWSARIDAYLEGSPLADYGQVFAEAAWDNGVDPRWSPAISNTESSKGWVCFMPCNAWGWGEGGWSDWETAIRAHVAGLASGYGYSITPEAAMKYCPPNFAHWYTSTLYQMATI